MNSTQLMRVRKLFGTGWLLLTILMPLSAAAISTPPEPIELSTGWQLQDIAKVPQNGAEVSQPSFKTIGWYAATVPGTILTTLVNNKVYPEPLYGENDRPDIIPDSLARTSYWYRTTITIPRSYDGRHIWLNFEGINYTAIVWVNGAQAGTIHGAFIRGIFDISSHVHPGGSAVVAVLISPQPHPGVPHEHTLLAGMGRNGGITAIDGPTFLDTIGWDWMPAMRDRDSGIWQKVFLSATGPVLIKDPHVTTDLPLPNIDSADVAIQATVENITSQPQNGVLQGSIGNITFQQPVEIAPRSSQIISFDPKSIRALHITHPRLWWPNGYGAQDLYNLHLSFVQQKEVSDTSDVTFGIRTITYSVPGSDDLAISVNGVPVFIRGGDWGMDEAMKRNPHARLEAEIRMHQLAHLNMIRNWVGQSTSEDFYELCDKYGILVWDEFFQPNPSDGPNPDDFDVYMANVRDKILRFRNHPSIALWCGRNEGFPPHEIDDALRKLMAEIDPTRLYQPSSTDGRGVRSSGPYHWRAPNEFYIIDTAFKTETGSMSIPTLESIHGMMPEKDWNTINNDWAEHDFARGAMDGDTFPGVLAARYGAIANLADFVRKAQLANYEAYRAMFEGRNAHLFHPTTGVLAWMTQTAHPSFGFQLYHYDLEPESAYFATMKASEPLHIQFNQASNELQVINNLPSTLENATARLAIYNFDGALAYRREYNVTAPSDAATTVGEFDPPPSLSSIHFIQLELYDGNGKLLSENFYWRTQPQNYNKLEGLNNLPVVNLKATVQRKDVDGNSLFTVTLYNSSSTIALMAHLQLRRRSGERVLPVYYSDNYISLVPGKSKTIAIQASLSDLQGEDAMIVLDGWNTQVISASAPGVAISTNADAQVDHWPATGLPFQIADQH